MESVSSLGKNINENRPYNYSNTKGSCLTAFVKELRVQEFPNNSFLAPKPSLSTCACSQLHTPKLHLC
jgi:hypothetical protein